MADFSEQSASLQPNTQGAGGIAVQRFTPETPSNSGAAVGALAAMLGQGVQSYADSEMIKAKNGVLKQISQSQSQINNAVATGQMSAQEAHVRSQATYNSALASYPQLATDITGLNAAFKATTNTGDTDKTYQNDVDTAQKITNEQNSSAISNGYHLSADMTPAQRGAVVAANEAGIQSQKQLQLQQANFDFQKSQVGWTQAQEDRTRKFQSVDMLNNLADHNMNAFDATVQSLQADVAANRKTPEQAAQVLQSQYGMMSGAIQSAAGVNPDLATSTQSIFKSKYELGLKLIDPKSASDAVQRDFNDTMTRGKLSVLNSDPQVQKIVSASQLFGNNNLILQAQAAPVVMNALAKTSVSPVKNGVSQGYSPQIVGNPEIEADTLKSLSASVDNLRGGKIANKDEALQEGSNVVNNLLVQTGQAMSQGADPSKLKPIAGFLASSQYAYMMQHGQIDPQANQAAKQVFQKSYEPAITQAVGNRMQDAVPGTTLKAIDAVDANFTAAGVNFTPRKGLPADQVPAVENYIKNSLSSSAMGMNTALRVGAHMEGRTDYQQYWNDNKYILLPQLYPVKPKQNVNGMVWSGNGDWRDSSTWSRASGSK